MTNEKIGKRVGSPSGELRDSGERASKRNGGLWPPGFHFLPFQALRASFPGGKPARVRFEAHVGLIDEKVLGTNDSNGKSEPPEVRGAPRMRWGDVKQVQVGSDDEGTSAGFGR